jgi:serine/threonine protein phosphatase PrpC
MVRKVNEDALLENSEVGIWAVADGMGGHAAGDVASRMVVESLASLGIQSSSEAMIDAVDNRLREVNQRLRAASSKDYQNRVMGSTVVVLGVFGEVAVCLWVGDSRAYHFKNGALRQLTHDHSHVQTLVDQGLIAAHEAELHPMANVVTRAVGANDTLQIDHTQVHMGGDDRFLLCSDGLTRIVDDSEIEQTLARAGDQEAVQALTHLALVRGAPDNVTSVLVSINREPSESRLS